MEDSTELTRGLIVARSCAVRTILRVGRWRRDGSLVARDKFGEGCVLLSKERSRSASTVVNAAKLLSCSEYVLENHVHEIPRRPTCTVTIVEDSVDANSEQTLVLSEGPRYYIPACVVRTQGNSGDGACLAPGARAVQATAKLYAAHDVSLQFHHPTTFMLAPSRYSLGAKDKDCTTDRPVARSATKFCLQDTCCHSSEGAVELN